MGGRPAAVYDAVLSGAVASGQKKAVVKCPSTPDQLGVQSGDGGPVGRRPQKNDAFQGHGPGHEAVVGIGANQNTHALPMGYRNRLFETHRRILSGVFPFNVLNYEKCHG